MDERMLAAGLLGLFLIGLGIAGDGDLEMAETQAGNYCHMVALYKRTQGENGWPDYRGDYAEVCK